MCFYEYVRPYCTCSNIRNCNRHGGKVCGQEYDSYPKRDDAGERVVLRCFYYISTDAEERAKCTGIGDDPKKCWTKEDVGLCHECMKETWRKPGQKGLGK